MKQILMGFAIFVIILVFLNFKLHITNNIITTTTVYNNRSLANFEKIIYTDTTLRQETNFSHTILFSKNKILDQQQQHTYATFMASTTFIPALEVFLYTFSQTKSKYPITICVPNSVNHTVLVKTVISVLEKYDNIDWNIDIWPIIAAPKNGEEHPRWTINWTKLQLWTMTKYKSIFYVDLDVIFYRNIDHVFHRDFNSFIGTYDWGRWSRIGKKKLNGGVFLLQPSMVMFSKLIKNMTNVTDYFAMEAEQGLINKFFKDEHCCLPVYYNFQKTLYDPKNPLLMEQIISILHFTGEKPWMSWSSTNFRTTFVPAIIKKNLKKFDSWDADDYVDLHDKWKSLYLLARKSEFQNLTVFQGYHQKSCWEYLSYPKTFYYRSVRLNGPRKNGIDIDALHYARELRYIGNQTALGEFGSMLAIDSLEDYKVTPFVGFTSWKEAKKANFKEGASLDLTKLDFKQNTIYFWYSIYGKNKTYYEVLDKEHSGMLAVLKELVPFPLPPMNNQNYIYGNYFITSKEIFKNYMKSAIEFKNNFLLKYPIGSKCPYCVPPDVRQAEKRCIGYILERYINIWMTHMNINMVYAVDHPEWRLK